VDEKTLIARRVALELKEGDLVNLGIGLPTLVAAFVPKDADIFFQSENGIIGMLALPEEGLETEDLTDAGGGPIGALAGAATFDSAMSFGLIRGGHLDLTVLGGLQVDQKGRLANWMIPGRMVPGMGGAMDLVSGAKRVIVAMTHTAKGKSKIVRQCALPVTSVRPVSLIVTEMAVIEPTAQGLVLRELAPGVTVAAVQQATEAELIIPEHVPDMPVVEPPPRPADCPSTQRYGCA
jgi:acetate CoA/acetoacetate CoA-transferase beta subunit